MNQHDRIATPEWVASKRSDRQVDTALVGGWVATPAPLARGAAFTDFSSRHISVPPGDDELSTAVRLHELLHVRYSPSAVPSSLMAQLGLPVQTVRVAEEMRMNLLGAGTQSMFAAKGRGYVTNEQRHDRTKLKNIIAQMKDGTEKSSADFAVQNNDFRSAVCLMYATYGLDCFRDVKRRLRLKPEWKDAVAGIAKHLEYNYSLGNCYTETSEYGSTAPVAYKWVEGFRSERSVTLPFGFTHATLAIANEIEQIIEDGGVGDKRVGKDGMEPIESDQHDDDSERRKRRSVSNVSWCGLRLGITSLTETTATFIGRRKRPAITGKYPSRPDRLLTDPERRIFRETVRGDGGIVVFDCSGSMGVDYEVVRGAVAQFAGATVLAYSHNGAGVANAWVLAKNGRMVDAEEMNRLPLNQGNGVDGQALRWAVKQRRSPREFILWVCDLGVTGVNDWGNPDLLTDCANICRKHNIAQVHSTEEALAVLADIKRTGSVGRRSWSEQLGKRVAEIESGRISVPIVGVAYDK